MEKGEFRFTGSTQELLDRPDILRSVFIAGANAPTPTKGRKRTAKAAVPATPTRNAPPPDAPVILACDNLTKRFGGITAVDRVDLELREGEILALIGQNGAGKTTLFDCISGFLPVDSGRVRLRDEDITDLAPHERAARGLGRSFQEARLFPSLTTEETLAIARERHLLSRGFVAAALGQPVARDSEEDTAEKVAFLVELMGLGRVPGEADRGALHRLAAHRRAGRSARLGPGRDRAR